MFNLMYNQYSTKRIVLKFYCPDCKKLVEEEIENIPYPDLNAEKDTHSATSNCDSANCICQTCNKEFEIGLCSSICSGELYSDD